MAEQEADGQPALRWEHRLRVLVTLDPAAPERVVRCFLDGSRTSCIVQPRHRIFLPAVLTRDESQRRSLLARLAIRLTDREARVLFAPGHRFVIWDDALVGQTVRGEGLIGHGLRRDPRSRG